MNELPDVKEGYEPVWCHHCGTYSFAKEWTTSGLGFPNDTCPVCGDSYPGHMDGPLENEPRSRRLVAAINREEVWG